MNIEEMKSHLNNLKELRKLLEREIKVLEEIIFREIYGFGAGDTIKIDDQFREKTTSHSVSFYHNAVKEAQFITISSTYLRSSTVGCSVGAYIMDVEITVIQRLLELT